MSVSVFLAFGYGILSFVSPCILPLIPVYLANISGQGQPAGKQKRLDVFIRSLAFVAGFTIVFTLWGVGAGVLGSFLTSYMVVIQKIAGIIMALFGIMMLAALKIPWLNFEAGMRVNPIQRLGLLRPFIVGAIFPIAWTPCASWVLGSILMLAGTSETAAQGALLLAAYSLGLGVPFLAAGIALDYLSPLLKNIRRFSTIIYVISGLLLISTGILVYFDRLNWLIGAI
jgi:cytochrome c-type biogenesis protein